MLQVCSVPVSGVRWRALTRTMYNLPPGTDSEQFKDRLVAHTAVIRQKLTFGSGTEGEASVWLGLKVQEQQVNDDDDSGDAPWRYKVVGAINFDQDRCVSKCIWEWECHSEYTGMRY